MDKRPVTLLAHAARVRLGLAAFVLVALAGCVEGYNPELEGRWRLVGQKYDLVIDLRADGRYQAMTDVGTKLGRWEQVDNEHIATWSDESQPKRVSAFKIEGDNLTITDTSNTPLEHVRLH